MATKVISARVPLDVYAMLETLSKQQGQSKNKIVGDLISTSAMTPSLLSTGKPTIKVKPIPLMLKNVLIGVGGAGVGYIVYELLQKHLPNYNFTTEEVNDISALAAIASGLGTSAFLASLLRDSE
jgi:hypothetical protein